MAPKMGEGGQIWLKCITGDLIMMIRDKNNIFERVENIHADLAKNYPRSDVVHESIAKMDCSRHRFVKKDEYRKTLRIECVGTGRILARAIQFILALDIIFN